MYYFGSLHFHHILILDLLGPSLEDLFHSCGGRFSVQTVAMLADQMVSNCVFHVRRDVFTPCTVVDGPERPREVHDLP